MEMNGDTRHLQAASFGLHHGHALLPGQRRVGPQLVEALLHLIA